MSFEKTDILAAGIELAALQKYLTILFPGRKHEVDLQVDQQQWIERIIKPTQDPNTWPKMDMRLSEQMYFIFPAFARNPELNRNITQPSDASMMFRMFQRSVGPRITLRTAVDFILIGIDPSVLDISSELWERWRDLLAVARTKGEWKEAAYIAASLAVISSDRIEVTNDNEIQLLRNVKRLRQDIPLPPRPHE